MKVMSECMILSQALKQFHPFYTDTVLLDESFLCFALSYDISFLCILLPMSESGIFLFKKSLGLVLWTLSAF